MPTNRVCVYCGEEGSDDQPLESVEFLSDDGKQSCNYPFHRSCFDANRLEPPAPLHPDPKVKERCHPYWKPRTF